MKKLLALLICFLCLMAGAAVAQENVIVSYSLPEGGRECHITEAYTLQAPEGLAEMYDLMCHTARRDDVYLIAMPNGRALLSLSCTIVERPRTAEELAMLWPQAARSISGYVDAVNADMGCVSIEERWGYQVMRVDTQVTVGGSEPLELDAQGWAFCRGNDLMELWTAVPSGTRNRLQPEELKLLAEDQQALETMLEQMDFGEASFNGANVIDDFLNPKPDWPYERQPYTDPSGVFSIDCPVGAVALPMDAPDEAFAQAREAFLAVNPAGAQMFDEWVEDARNLRQQGDGGCTLLVMPEQKAAFQVSWETDGYFNQMTTDQLHLLAGVLQDQLTERYGLAALLDNGWEMLDGEMGTEMEYWVRCGDINMALNIYSAVRSDGLFVDVEWFCLSDADVGLAQQQLDLLLKTLRFAQPGMQV